MNSLNLIAQIVIQKIIEDESTPSVDLSAYEYNLVNGKATLTKYIGEEASVKVPVIGE